MMLIFFQVFFLLAFFCYLLEAGVFLSTVILLDFLKAQLASFLLLSFRLFSYIFLHKVGLFSSPISPADALYSPIETAKAYSFCRILSSLASIISSRRHYSHPLPRVPCST